MSDVAYGLTCDGNKLNGVIRVINHTGHTDTDTNVDTNNTCGKIVDTNLITVRNDRDFNLSDKMVGHSGLERTSFIFVENLKIAGI